MLRTHSIRHNAIQFSCLGGPVPRICAPVGCIVVWFDSMCINVTLPVYNSLNEHNLYLMCVLRNLYCSTIQRARNLGSHRYCMPRYECLILFFTFWCVMSSVSTLYFSSVFLCCWFIYCRLVVLKSRFFMGICSVGWLISFVVHWVCWRYIFIWAVVWSGINGLMPACRKYMLYTNHSSDDRDIRSGGSVMGTLPTVL